MSLGKQGTDVKACLKEIGLSGKWTYCWDREGSFVYGDGPHVLFEIHSMDYLLSA